MFVSKKFVELTSLHFEDIEELELIAETLAQRISKAPTTKLPGKERDKLCAVLETIEANFMGGKRK